MNEKNMVRNIVIHQMMKRALNSRGQNTSSRNFIQGIPLSRSVEKSIVLSGRPRLLTMQQAAKTIREVILGNGPLSLLKKALREGVNANGVMDKEYTILEGAVNKGRYDIIKTLVDAGADVNKRPLLIRARRGGEKMVRFLLNFNVNVNGVDSNGNSALFYASLDGFDAIVQLLLRHNANPFLKNKYGETPLDCTQKSTTMGILLHAMKSMNARNLKGLLNKRLISASNEGFSTEMRMLVDAGADPNAENGKALLHAINHVNLLDARMLLDMGANPSIQPKILEDALYIDYMDHPHYGYDPGEYKFTRLLIEYGVNVNVNVNLSERTIRGNIHDNISVVRYALRSGVKPLIRLILVDGKARVNVSDLIVTLEESEYNGKSIVYSVKSLLDAGVNPKSKDSSGKSPMDSVIQLLAHSGNDYSTTFITKLMEIVQMFIARGAVVNRNVRSKIDTLDNKSLKRKLVKVIKNGKI